MVKEEVKEESNEERFGDNVGKPMDPNHARNQQLPGSAVNQSGRKRKQPVLSSGPANSSGIANTVGPSPSSAPSTHTPGDAISMTNLLRSCRCMDVSKGLTFSEVNSVRVSTGKVISCDFSSDGKLLASAGHDKKAVLWHTYTMKPKTILEGHTALITDVRFSPNLPRLATSSFDKTVRVWDIANEGSCLGTFMGHSSMVTSLDFHPNKDDLICSCEKDGEIRYWSINNGSCTRVYKGSSTQKSFQPRVRKYDAASVAGGEVPTTCWKVSCGFIRKCCICTRCRNTSLPTLFAGPFYSDKLGLLGSFW